MNSTVGENPGPGNRFRDRETEQARNGMSHQIQ